MAEIVVAARLSLRKFIRKYVEKCVQVHAGGVHRKQRAGESSKCLKVTFERSYIVNYNPKFVKYAFANVTRYGRRSGYLGNLEFETTYVVNNNVSAHIFFYEFRRNVYKRSFIEFHYKMCDFLDHDPYIGKIALEAGVTCPIQARRYMLNITLNSLDFPSAFPFEKGRINFCFNSTETGESVGEGALYLSFKNEARNKHG